MMQRLLYFSRIILFFFFLILFLKFGYFVEVCGVTQIIDMGGSELL